MKTALIAAVILLGFMVLYPGLVGMGAGMGLIVAVDSIPVTP